MVPAKSVNIIIPNVFTQHIGYSVGYNEIHALCWQHSHLSPTLLRGGGGGETKKKRLTLVVKIEQTVTLPLTVWHHKTSPESPTL